MHWTWTIKCVGGDGDRRAQASNHWNTGRPRLWSPVRSLLRNRQHKLSWDRRAKAGKVRSHVERHSSETSRWNVARNTTENAFRPFLWAPQDWQVNRTTGSTGKSWPKL